MLHAFPPHAQLKVTSSGCWEWQGGARTQRGYGMRWDPTAKRMVYLHRINYEQVNGPIPEGLQIDHLCRNTGCCNPDHLQAVTQRENIRRGVGPTAVNAAKTHCPQGHPYSADNLVARSNGRRQCKTCAREAMRLKRSLVR